MTHGTRSQALLRMWLACDVRRLALLSVSFSPVGLPHSATLCADKVFQDCYEYFRRELLGVAGADISGCIVPNSLLMSETIFKSNQQYIPCTSRPAHSGCLNARDLSTPPWCRTEGLIELHIVSESQGSARLIIWNLCFSETRRDRYNNNCPVSNQL